MKTRVWAACMAMASWALPSAAAEPVRYTTHSVTPMKDASVQTVSFDRVAGLDARALGRIDAALKAAADAFAREARTCRAAAQGNLWGYDITLDKVVPSEKYLSVVFAKWTVCAGSPDIERIARVFSRPSGRLVPARRLFGQRFPGATPAADASRDNDLVQLDDDMAEAMFDDSREVLNNYDSRCEFFLKTASYRIWVDGSGLIQFPEFLQPWSFCQKEYLLRATP